jgi:acyl transferase domain-containing protein
VVGHSSGEIAAAYANGAISRESAWMVAYFRGLAVAITRDLVGSVGSMVAVQATPGVIEPLLKRQNLAHPQDSVVIACYNSLSNITVSGSRDAVNRLSGIFTDESVTSRLLKVDVAYHSHHMSTVAAVYRRLLRPLEAGSEQKHRPRFVSTVTGQAAGDVSMLRTPDYWLSNLKFPVKFDIALAEICTSRDKLSTAAMADMFLEIGPHSTLRSPIKDILSAHGKNIVTDYTSVLARNRAADLTALDCAGKLYASGILIDLLEVNRLQDDKCTLITTLPPYSFNDKTKYWLEGRASAQYRFRKHVHHEFLGTRVDDWNECEPRWTNRIILERSSWLKDHRVNGSIIFPAAAFIVMALEAVRQLHKDQVHIIGYKMRDVQFPRAVTLSQEPRGTELQFTLRKGKVQLEDSSSEPIWNEYLIHVYDKEGWAECCTGAIAVEYEASYPEPCGVNNHGEFLDSNARTLTAAINEIQGLVRTSDIYDAFERAGLEYGTFFKGIQNVRWNGTGEATGTVDLKQWRSLHEEFTDPHLIHPTALDAILQMTFPAYSIYSKNATATTVPTGFPSAWFSACIGRASLGSEALVHAKVVERGFRKKLFSIAAMLSKGNTPFFLGTMETSTIGSGDTSLDVQDKPLYRIVYKPDIELRSNRILYLESDLRKKERSLKQDKEVLCIQSMRSALDHASSSIGTLPIHLQDYIKWMRIRTNAYDSTIPETVEALCQRLEHTDVEGRLLVRVARNLIPILAGEVDPLHLLFADELLSEFYSDFHSNRQLLARAAEEASLMAHKNPAMRVLEIGAGTGSATEHILGALGNQLEYYVYTDITPSFFMKARDRFTSSKLTFKTLDVSQDPLSQGYEEGNFDLIIAANVSIFLSITCVITDLCRYYTPPTVSRMH